jgi:hypothetical protein
LAGLQEQPLMFPTKFLLTVIFVGWCLKLPAAALEIGLPQQEIVCNDESVPAGPSIGGWPSRDGRFIAFTWEFDDIVPGDGNSVEGCVPI